MVIRKFYILLILLLSCTSHRDTDLDILCESISQDNSIKSRDFESESFIFPNRIKDSFENYRFISNQINEIIISIDSLQNLSFRDFSDNSDKIRNGIDLLNKSILFISDSSTARFLYRNDEPIDTIYETDNINTLLIVSSYKIYNTKRTTFRQDLGFIKLNLLLIERDILELIKSRISAKTFPVDYLEPVIVESKNKVDCYVTAIDRESHGMIIIGRFKEVVYDSISYYKLIEAFDTIKLINAKAEFSKELLKKGDAVLYITMPDGTSLQRKINK